MRCPPPALVARAQTVTCGWMLWPHMTPHLLLHLVLCLRPPPSAVLSSPPQGTASLGPSPWPQQGGRSCNTGKGTHSREHLLWASAHRSSCLHFSRKDTETQQVHNMSSRSGLLLVSGAPGFGPGRPAAEREPFGAAGDRSPGIRGLESARASCVSWKKLRDRATPRWPTEHVIPFSPGTMACQPAPTAPRAHCPGHK